MTSSPQPRRSRRLAGRSAPGATKRVRRRLTYSDDDDIVTALCNLSPPSPSSAESDPAAAAPSSQPSVDYESDWLTSDEDDFIDDDGVFDSDGTEHRRVTVELGDNAATEVLDGYNVSAHHMWSAYVYVAVRVLLGDEFDAIVAEQPAWARMSERARAPIDMRLLVCPENAVYDCARANRYMDIAMPRYAGVARVCDVCGRVRKQTATVSFYDIGSRTGQSRQFAVSSVCLAWLRSRHEFMWFDAHLCDAICAWLPSLLPEAIERSRRHYTALAFLYLHPKWPTRMQTRFHYISAAIDKIVDDNVMFYHCPSDGD